MTVGKVTPEKMYEEIGADISVAAANPAEVLDTPSEADMFAAVDAANASKKVRGGGQEPPTPPDRSARLAPNTTEQTPKESPSDESPKDEADKSSSFKFDKAAAPADLDFLQDKPKEEKKEPKSEDEPKDDPAADHTDQNKKPDEKPIDPNKLTSMKALREIITKVETERDDFRQRLEKAEKERGEATPEVVQTLNKQIETLQARVAQLEPMEILFALNQNPGYRARYIDGPKALEQSAAKVLKDYGLESSFFLQATGYTNRKDLNAFLKSKIGDEDAREDVRRHVFQYQQLLEERRAADQFPQQTLKNIEEATRLAKAEDLEKRKKIAGVNAAAGWHSALSTLTEGDDSILELRTIPGNQAHNEKTVTPLLQEAERLNNYVLNQILRSGGQIDKDLAGTVAMMAQMAAALRTVTAGRQDYFERWKKSQTELERIHAIENPGYSATPYSNGGGAAPSGAAALAPKKGQSGYEAAEAIALGALQEGIQPQN